MAGLCNLRAGGITNRSAALLFSRHGTWRAHKNCWPCESGRRKGADRPSPRLLPSGDETFEELKLWNDMIFVEVPQHRHFVCSQCGSPREGNADLSSGAEYARTWYGLAAFPERMVISQG